MFWQADEDLRVIHRCGPQHYKHHSKSFINISKKQPERLKKLKAFKSQGFDGIHTGVFKELAEQLCTPM